MPHFNIEKGVQLPDILRSTGVSKNQDVIDVLLSMEVMDSFTMPLKRRSSFWSIVGMLKKNGSAGTKKWAIRKEDSVTIRVWRVE